MEATVTARNAQVVGGGVDETSPTALAVLRALRAAQGIAPVTIDEMRLHLRVPRRMIEEAVETLRLAGEPIVADNFGLHLASDPIELERYVEARRRRLVTIYLGTRALRLTARRMRETTDLTLWGAAA